MTRTTWISGPLFASLVAGPVFTLALFAMLALGTPTSAGSAFAGFGLILVFSLPVGFVAALVPNLAGAGLLAWVGKRWHPARHPFGWAATGAAFGWLIGAAAVGGLAAFPMAATGAVCASICRRLVVWPD